jgi:hypothetical protein
MEVTGSLNGLTLPSQFFLSARESHDYWTGSRRLMLSVLQDALASWFRYRRDSSKRGRRLFRETHDWFWASDRSWLYAFESICEHLELDPNFIRGQLRRQRPAWARRRKPLLRRQAASSSKHETLAA